MLDVKETTLHVNMYHAWYKKPFYDIPAEYGMINDSRPILEKEVNAIPDEARRSEIMEIVIQQMEAT